MSLYRRDFLGRACTLPLIAGGASLLTRAAGEPALPTYSCHKVPHFSLDGNVEKPVWKQAAVISMVSASGRKQKLYPTTFRACWSDTHLYVAFHCIDPDIRATFTERDSALYDEDVVEVFLCADGDLHRYYELEFSPRNIIFDAIITNPGLSSSGFTGDRAWNCDGLESRVKLIGGSGDPKRPDTSWSVEAAIPFAGLGVSAPSAGDRWRANFYRIDYSTPTQYSAWSPTLAFPAAYHVPKRFGWLAFDGPAR